MCVDLKFKHPFSCNVNGPSPSGKSSICIRFLQYLDALCYEPEFDRGVICCFSERNAVTSRQLAVLKNKICFNEGEPADIENSSGRTCLIILDDLLNNVYSEDVCELFTKGSRHRNISIILITQNLFHQGRY